MRQNSPTLAAAADKLLIGNLEKEILAALAYFDVFSYPLTASELSQNIKSTAGIKELFAALTNLAELGFIKKSEPFFFLSSSDTKIVEKRKKGNAGAQAVMPKAFRAAKFIAKFPFVESVGISGSLSKNYFDKDADVDFFIISSPGRLWVCRTFLVGFKKIFLLNSKKFFCVNYFVDTANMFIPDKNIFTATEISYLKPAYNFEKFSEFVKENEWTKDFLPNKKTDRSDLCSPEKKFFLKSFIEKLLKGKRGENLDNYFFRLTLKRWKKKFSHFNESDFDLNMRSRKTVSKHHPNGFQLKVLNGYTERMKIIEEKLAGLI